MKKMLVYAVLLAALAGTAFVVHEVRMANEVVRNPELFTDGGASPTPREEAAFAKPPPGKREKMTASELAWMLKESIELDVVEHFAVRGPALDAYNARVRGYNERAEAIVYIDADMETAKRRVEVSLDEIVHGAIDGALAASMPDTGDRTVRTAQTYLRAMGLYPSEPDGRESGETAHAVRTFQMATGLPVTGEIDEKLLGHLRDALAKKLRPEKIGF